MALKIVHLCDVHAAKGEDIPAQFAHSMLVDGGTYAIDLCPQCDAERFLPLVAFLDAFGLLTDGTVDPRAAVAENLRQSVAPPAPPVPQRIRVRGPLRPTEPAEPAETTTAAQAGERLLAVLRAHPEGIGIAALLEAAGLAHGTGTRTLSALRREGRAEVLARLWWLPENIPDDLRARMQRERAAVRERDATPRVCIVCGEESPTQADYTEHFEGVHGVKPTEVHGLRCPIDGEEFNTPQLLGMHGRIAHDCVHTPQLFQQALQAGDPFGIIAGIRAKYGTGEVAE